MDEQPLLSVGRKPDQNAVIARHNNLMEARYSASPQEQRLFLWAVYQAQEGSIGSQIVRVSIVELARFIGVEGNGSMYAQMVDVTDRIRRRMVTIKNSETGQLVQANLMNARYQAGSGYVEVELSQFVLPYILELKKNFTTVELKYAMRLGSGHAMRIYDLLKARNYRGGHVAIDVDELQLLLGTTGKYPRFNNFRQFVLDVSCEEINKRTDLNVGFKVLPARSDKRKAGSIVFNIKSGDGKREVPYMPGSSADNLVKRLTRVGLAQKDAVEVVESYGETDPDRITWHLGELERKYQKGEIKAPAAWLRAAIRSDYRQKKSEFEIEQDRKARLAVEQRDARARTLAVERAAASDKEQVLSKVREQRALRLRALVSKLKSAEREEWIVDVTARLKPGLIRDRWLAAPDLLSPFFHNQVVEVARARQFDLNC